MDTYGFDTHSHKAATSLSTAPTPPDRGEADVRAFHDQGGTSDHIKLSDCTVGMTAHRVHTNPSASLGPQEFSPK